MYGSSTWHTVTTSNDMVLSNCNGRSPIEAKRLLLSLVFIQPKWGCIHYRCAPKDRLSLYIYPMDRHSTQNFLHVRQIMALLGFTPLSLMFNLIACPKHARCRAPLKIIVFCRGHPLGIFSSFGVSSLIVRVVKDWKSQRVRCAQDTEYFLRSPRTRKRSWKRSPTIFDFVDNSRCREWKHSLLCVNENGKGGCC